MGFRYRYIQSLGYNRCGLLIKAVEKHIKIKWTLLYMKQFPWVYLIGTIRKLTTITHFITVVMPVLKWL